MMSEHMLYAGSLIPNAGGSSVEATARARGCDRARDAVKAILDLSAGFLRPDPEVIHMFEDSMAAPSPLLRKATLQAIAYRRWPDAKPLVGEPGENAAAVRRFGAPPDVTSDLRIGWSDGGG
jgi:hypothetical protein